MNDSRLRPFFQPAGVAVIGATTDTGKLGYRLASNLVESEYPGAIHLVNPKGGRFGELPIYESVGAVPDPVELAVLLIQAPFTPGALRECGERGIVAAVIASAGFAESGDEGARIEQECSDIASEFGIRVIGPNCVGTIDTHFPLDASFLNSGRVPEGRIALVSHSGAMVAGIINMSAPLGLGWSRIVSLGNQMDVNETDILDVLALDDQTRAVALYLEGVKGGSRFIEVAAKLSRTKPIVAFKVGRTESGRGAVKSHTGALAGDDQIYEAVFRRAGVIRAETTEDLLTASKALASAPLPRGDSVAVLTNAGGPGVAAIDYLERAGLRMATLSDRSVKRLSEMLPPAATVTNPVDMLASASIADYLGGLDILLDDSQVDSIIVVMPPPPHFPAEGAIAAMETELQGASKPVVFALVGGGAVGEAVRMLDRIGIANYRFPEQASRAIDVLVQRAAYLKRLRSELDADAVNIDRRCEGMDGIEPSIPGEAGFLRLDYAAELAAASGIRIAPSVFAEDVDQVESLAKRLVFPVALKVASPDLIHKSARGGIRLGVESIDAAAEVARDMVSSTSMSPGDGAASLDGILIQSMQPDGVDVAVGAVHDPQFGPVVMFGAGGAGIEEERDVTFEVVPLGPGDARRMLERTRVGRRLLRKQLDGSTDVDAVVDAITRVAALIAQLDCIEEFEINPLRVFARDQGAVALDVRCRRS